MTNRILYLFEDTQTRLELSKTEIKDLMKLKDIIGEQNVKIHVDGKIMISHYVGFVNIGKTRLLVYPKVARNMDDTTHRDKSFEVLIKLLHYSNFSSVKKLPSSQMMGKYKGDILELFIGIFIDELMYRLERDINRGYEAIQENQSFIKGKIDFPQTIKKNSYRKHLHYVNYDHFTEDILMNRLFKTVISNLLKRTVSIDNKRKLKQTLTWFEDVELIRINDAHWDQVIFTRLNMNYKEVFSMAKLFYNNSSPNLNKGQEDVFSFMVPLNQLFERYVYLKVKETCEDTIQYQGPQKYLSEELKTYTLKPDITIRDNQHYMKIIDAKYKELKPEEKNFGISQQDLYQMLAYSTIYKCNTIELAYPMFLDQSEIYEHTIPISTEVMDLKIHIKQYDLECLI